MGIVPQRSFSRCPGHVRRSCSLVLPPFPRLRRPDHRILANRRILQIEHQSIKPARFLTLSLAASYQVLVNLPSLIPPVISPAMGRAMGRVYPPAIRGATGMAYPPAMGRATGRATLPATGKAIGSAALPAIGRVTDPATLPVTGRASGRATLRVTERAIPPVTGRAIGTVTSPATGRATGRDAASNPTAPATLGLTAGKASLQFTFNGSWPFPVLTGAR